MNYNRIVIDQIILDRNRIDYGYTIFGEWKKCFNEDNHFFIEYSIDISHVPESIAVVPFLANILPIAWICNAEIVVPECDKAFYESIKYFKNGYQQMYPNTNFAGNLIVGKLKENHSGTSGGSIAFFSGGVDAYNTLISHANEYPTLVTLWGADIKIEDEEGWHNVLKAVAASSREFNVDFISIKSFLRYFINEKELNKRICIDNWWHGYQHGIGIICHAAPISYLQKKKIIYFASSYTLADKGKVTCASDPSIDNFVRFGDSLVVHDGYEYTRQDKLVNIVRFSIESKKKIDLRVCWEAKGGTNCCNCEKCWRTILGIYSLNADPREYGFEFNNLTEISKKIFRNQYLLRHNRFYYYLDIQKSMRKNYTPTTIDPSLLWFYNKDIDELGKESVFCKIARRLKFVKNYIGR